MCEPNTCPDCSNCPTQLINGAIIDFSKGLISFESIDTFMSVVNHIKSIHTSPILRSGLSSNIVKAWKKANLNEFLYKLKVEHS